MNEDRYLNKTQTFWTYLKKIGGNNLILASDKIASRVSRHFQYLGKYVLVLTSVWPNVIF